MCKPLTEAEHYNLTQFGFVQQYKKGMAVTLTSKFCSFLTEVLNRVVPELAQSYHEDVIQRWFRLASLILTVCRGVNLWGSTRIAAIAHLGTLLCVMYYACPGIGKLLALTDGLNAFTNQTVCFQDAWQAFSLPERAIATSWRN